MEALYAKLYNKYEALKKKRLSELDEINKDQEGKFLNYVSAVEELIQHFKDENDRLRTQVSELRRDVASIRSTKDDECAKYQKLFMEETEKNKMLSKEVERLQHLQEQLSFHSENGKNANRQMSVTEMAEVTPREATSYSKRNMTRKRTQEAMAGMVVSTPAQSDQDALLLRESTKGSPGGTLSTGNLENEQQPQCCRGAVQRPGVGVDNGSAYTNFQFQALLEYLLGMKLSAVNQTEGICISALHQSSGYSFSLTWVKKAAGEDPELLYRVLTLGTFELVAPEWMRSALIFSTSMCPIFFERLARVLKVHH